MTKKLFTLLSCLLALPACAEQGQTAFSEYKEVYPLFWGQVYGKGGETLYCGEPFGQPKKRGINIEHIFPMSWVMKNEGCHSRKQCRETSRRFNRIEADMHNLYPARSDINEARRSMAFAEINGEKRQFGKCDFEIDKHRYRVEPRPASRGNIARAMFYMHDTYGLKIFSRQGNMLKRWHREDPPDREEQRRNAVIGRIQGIRNRFIDTPSAVAQLKF